MPQTATQALSLTVAAPLVIATTTLPTAVQGQAYSVQLVATGGVGPYTWSVTLGALPSGMTLSASGLLAGTPTVSGVFAVTVSATDSS